MICKKCKKEIPDNSLYCLHCGAPQKRNPQKKMYQRPDGLYEQVKTINGKRVYFRGKSEKEVLDKMVAYQEKKINGPLFREVAQNCKEEHFAEVAYNTRRGYAAGYIDLIERFGDRYATDISPADILSWLGELKRKGYAGKTIRNRFSVAKIIFRHLCSGKYGNISHDPTSLITLPKNLPKQKRKPPETSDLSTILNHTNEPAGFLMAFLAFTGLRFGEAQAIQGMDIDLAQRLIYVRKSVYYENNVPKIKPPKTEAGNRTILLPDYLVPLLPKLQPSSYLFGDESGNLMHFTRLRRMIQRFQEKYSVTATPHQMRHFYATLCHDAGLDPKDAQYILGHSSVAVTEDIYTHISQERSKQTAKTLNDFITVYAENTQKC